MDDHDTDKSDLLWRRNLSAAERAKLNLEPAQELEARLTRALSQMPDQPAPSNFTARVLAAIEREENRAARPQGRHWNWRVLWPRLAATAAILIFAGVSLQRYKGHTQKADMAQNLAQVASTPVPSVDTLEDLDAIQRMSQSSHADGELLAALQ
jgi:negative regulator of sigma E activity